MKNKLTTKLRKRAYLFMALFLLVVSVGVGGYLFNKKEVPEASVKKPVSEVIKKPDPIVPPDPIKETAHIAVPYTVQAPFANWPVHEESCEEAALLMYSYFLQGKTLDVIDPQTVDAELRKMKKWQVQNYGTEPDLSIEKLGVFAKGYYDYSYSVTKNVTIEDIKKQVSFNHPVLVPVMTHSLKNPHYGRQDTYHILLIKGYDAGGVYTNDAGIKEGNNYYYTWDVLFAAIDAQTAKMKQGRDLLTLSLN